MKPDRNTIFLPITELLKYSQGGEYCCSAVVFSPETENDHFIGCPPYIRIEDTNTFDKTYFFEVPEIVAYYAKTHPCYTMKGKENDRKAGQREMAQKIKGLLEI
jgi:hypothetical protein